MSTYFCLPREHATELDGGRSSAAGGAGVGDRVGVRVAQSGAWPERARAGAIVAVAVAFSAKVRPLLPDLVLSPAGGGVDRPRRRAVRPEGAERAQARIAQALRGFGGRRGVAHSERAASCAAAAGHRQAYARRISAAFARAHRPAGASVGGEIAAGGGPGASAGLGQGVAGTDAGRDM
eukprot:ctg_736.g349